MSDPSQADIEIEPGDLDTQNTGLIGLTSPQILNGQMQPGTTIELEDPSQDQLVTGPDGQVAYAGTDATLPQVLMHEIGHALGFADNADPNSIMSYYLGSANRTFDATDLTGIKELYGQGGAEGQYGVGSNGLGVSDSALIGRGTGDLYRIPSGLAGWPQSGLAGSANVIQHDPALFDGGGAFGTWATGGLESNATMTVSYSGYSDVLRQQAQLQNHMSG